jgi:hypothetical protein
MGSDIKGANITSTMVSSVGIKIEFDLIDRDAQKEKVSIK